MRAALRRSVQEAPEPVYKIEELEVDLLRRRVIVGGGKYSLRRLNTTS